VDKVERLTNIVALLLTTQRPLTLDEIADEVGGYPDKGESRRAAFERDKKTLRSEGVPLEVVPQHDGGSAYRIDPNTYYLPPLDLSDD
jgi:proteasome accessory factor B